MSIKNENNRRTGEEKETLASSFLEEHNCEILARNFYMRGGELDIVMKDGDYICFCEVKYRSSKDQGGASYAISYKKQQHIAKTALYFIKKKNIPLECPFRFDAILMDGEHITWIKNAFEFPENLGY